MNINDKNKQVIHVVLMADMQKRLFKQHNEIKVRNPFTIVTDEDFDNELSTMVNEILHCDSIRDINELVIRHTDLYFFKDWMTLDGTMNYILELLCDRITAHENDLKKYSI